MGKLGRNDPWWCGSGKKFKKCHWPQTASDVAADKIYEQLGSFGVGPLQQTLSLPMLKDPGTILERIKDEKAKDIRPLPSATLISLGSSPSQEERVFLVDTCACLVDQNWAGRCEMCVHFAILIRHGLELLGYQANVEVGKARYAMAGETFEWHHAWVCTEFGDIVDGNVDSMVENPYVPEVIKPRPYWGSSDSLPSDREFHKVRDLPSSRDEIECDAREISGWKRSLEDAIARRK